MHAYHIFIAHLCLFHRADEHVVVVARHKREAATLRTLVARGRESAQPTVERRSATGGLCHIQRTLVADDAIGEHMVSLVLMSLINEVVAGLRGIEQREAQRVVVGLVPAVAAVIQNGHTIGA